MRAERGGTASDTSDLGTASVLGAARHALGCSPRIPARTASFGVPAEVIPSSEPLHPASPGVPGVKIAWRPAPPT
jgi:hypothetical protein